MSQKRRLADLERRRPAEGQGCPTCQGPRAPVDYREAIAPLVPDAPADPPDPVCPDCGRPLSAIRIRPVPVPAPAADPEEGER
ncbi:MAG TPA: hypothetical protein VF310_12300 [Vicinamibacteria bacterium]